MTFNLAILLPQLPNVGITSLWLVICFAGVLGIELRALYIVGQVLSLTPTPPSGIKHVL